MTTGRTPIDASRVNDPLMQIPFDLVLLGAALLGLAFALWSALGLGDAYRSIGHDWIALDVPFADDQPVDRGGSR
jgi:hypothetical protein